MALTENSTKDYIYQMPNTHEFEGILYNGVFPVSKLHQIRNELELNNEDVVLSTYSKSGTTWLQEVIYLIYNGGDVTEIKQRSLDERFPFLEFTIPVGIPDYDLIMSRSSPRLIKTHLYSTFYERLLAKGQNGPKFVVGLRNPKDTLVSLYHFYQMNNEIGNYSGSWNDFFEIFRADQLIYGHPVGHALSWYKFKDNPNVKFVYYEDLHQDLEKAIRDLGQFFGRNITDGIIKSIEEYTNFQNMKDRRQPHVRFAPIIQENISPFLRKGKIGDWKNYFTSEQNEYFDKVYMKKIEGTNLKYTFEHSFTTKM